MLSDTPHEHEQLNTRAIHLEIKCRIRQLTFNLLRHLLEISFNYWCELLVRFPRMKIK